MDEIQNLLNKPKDFLKATETLRKDPYVCSLHGETLDTAFDVRDIFCKKVLGKDLESYKDDREKFVVWLFFQQRQITYASIDNIFAFCAKKKLEIDESVLTHLVQHSVMPKLYTSKLLYGYEQAVSILLSKKLKVLRPNLNCMIKNLDFDQNKAVNNILKSPYSVLQGNAGCGKTRTICELIKILVGENVPVFAAAYTHKAKNCMLENLRDVSVSISTVHSLIPKINSKSNMFLILDESSMLDLDLIGALANKLLSSNYISVQLCFVGDFFQIPPIGRGEIFRMLVEKKDHVNNLLKCYRTEKFDLEDNYSKIRSGEVPITNEHFVIHYCKNDCDINTNLKAFIDMHLNEYKIICWQNIHIKMINKWVQEKLLSREKIGPASFKGFYLNDNVVYCGENDEELTNATNGTVIAINPKSMTIKWDSGIEKKHDVIKDIMLSYAITCHKSQGSEFQNVCVVCYEVEKMIACMDRRWLYTSVTRGKDNVALFTTKKIEKFIKGDLKSIPISDMCI